MNLLYSFQISARSHAVSLNANVLAVLEMFNTSLAESIFISSVFPSLLTLGSECLRTFKDSLGLSVT